MTFSICIILCAYSDTSAQTTGILFLAEYYVHLQFLCSTAVISMRGYRQKTAKQNSMSRRQSSWRGGGIISNRGKWPVLETRKVWEGGGSQGFQARSGLSPLWKQKHRCPARQNTRLHTPWPTAKCKVKCGSNETCPIHHLKKRRKEMNFSEHPLWVRCYFLYLIPSWKSVSNLPASP